MAAVLGLGLGLGLGLFANDDDKSEDAGWVCKCADRMTCLLELPIWYTTPKIMTMKRSPKRASFAFVIATTEVEDDIIKNCYFGNNDNE